MPKHENTKIWNENLAIQTGNDTHESERRLLREAYEAMREKSSILSNEISASLPSFTIHDIDHLDGLWEMAQLLTGDTFQINPAEAFVLGGAILIHDIGMSIAAYPMKEAELRSTAQWQRLKSIELIKTNPNRKTLHENEINELVDKIYLREMHASRAAEITNVFWKDINNDRHYLIDNPDIRQTYGEIIGKIGYSHWLDVSQLEEYLGAVLGSPAGFPIDWTVDPVKIACILRCADAIQIDSRRAPSFLSALRPLDNTAQEHWIFQNKLYQPRLEDDRLVFTSKSSFDIEAINAWWLCYETLKYVDNEIRKVDYFLADTRRPRLSARSVANVDDTKRLSKLIQTRDWSPIDGNVHISKVASIVKHLGGESLYGDNPRAAIRELMQNSRDAILARRQLENFGNEYGKITVEIFIEQEKKYLKISDNGVGMSQRVLTDVLLDFGRSLWSDPVVFEEFPEAVLKFDNAGKYGIGFFSIFMIGERIKISTRRYELGRSDTIILEFGNSLNHRPIIRKAKQDEYLRDGGTEITIQLNDGIWEQLFRARESDSEEINLERLICYIAPAIDVDIHITEDGQTRKIITSDDWMYIDYRDLMNRIERSIYPKRPKKVYANENMHLVYDNGKAIARATIPTSVDGELYGTGILTISGFFSSSISGLIGIFSATPEKASRDQASPILSGQLLEKFLDTQWPIYNNLPHELQYRISNIFLTHSYIKPELICFIINDRYSSLAQIIELIESKTDFYLYSRYDLSKDINPTSSDIDFKLLMVCGQDFSYSPINSGRYGAWNINSTNEFPNSSTDVLITLISDIWNIKKDKVRRYFYSSKKMHKNIEFGSVKGEPVSIKSGTLVNYDAILEFTEED